jgi:hypothetical protein
MDTEVLVWIIIGIVVLFAILCNALYGGKTPSKTRPTVTIGVSRDEWLEEMLDLMKEQDAAKARKDRRNNAS